MFPYPIGSVLWTETAVALPQSPLTIQEIFQYDLSLPNLRLEEFQASLTPAPPENRGSILALSLTLDMIGLFLCPHAGERQTFQRHENILRRLPLSSFCFAEENHQPLQPEKWEAGISHFVYQPDLNHTTLTVTLSCCLHVCGTQTRLLPLEELFPSISTPQPENASLHQLQVELQHCRAEISHLQKQLQAHTEDKKKGEVKATIGRKTAAYRQTLRGLHE